METIETLVRHMCFDRVLPNALDLVALRLAVHENPENEAKPDVNDPRRLAILAQKRWRNGKLLRFRFLDGSPAMQAKVARYAMQWTQYANVQFDFSGSQYAEIRISFEADRGSWSAIGTDALVEQAFPLDQPTMNFGWLRDDTADEEYSRVVLHEVGHALGAIHEHQNPVGGIQWNKEAVYRYFSGPPNYWSRQEIDSNVLDKYREAALLGTKFDPASIMLYAFPASLTLNGVGTKSNDTLSPMDIDFIGRVYPR